MFALGGLIGVGGVYTGIVVVGSGQFALIVPALAFFIGGAIASAALRAGFLGGIGFGVAFVFGGIGSFLSVVGTQAMTGSESDLLILFFFPGSFATAWGVAGVVALGLLFRRLGSHVFRFGVIGFAGGGAISGLIVGLTAPRCWRRPP